MRYYKNGARHTAIGTKGFIEVLALPSITRISIGTNQNVIDNAEENDKDSTQLVFMETLYAALGELKSKQEMIKTN